MTEKKEIERLFVVCTVLFIGIVRTSILPWIERQQKSLEKCPRNYKEMIHNARLAGNLFSCCGGKYSESSNMVVLDTLGSQ
jgi:hypothetical protein